MGDHQGNCRGPGIALFYGGQRITNNGLIVARERSFLLKEVSTVVQMEHTLWIVG